MSESKVFLWPVRVYFEDTDAGGVAYHANYLRWAERGRTESLRAMGLPHSSLMAGHNSMLVVRRIEVEYVRPARLDDSLLVATRVVRVGGASVALGQDIMAEDGVTTLARMMVSLVCVREGSFRPSPLPRPWRDALGTLSVGALLVTEEPG